MEDWLQCQSNVIGGIRNGTSIGVISWNLLVKNSNDEAFLQHGDQGRRLCHKFAQQHQWQTYQPYDVVISCSNRRVFYSSVPLTFLNREGFLSYTINASSPPLWPIMACRTNPIELYSWLALATHYHLWYLLKNPREHVVTMHNQSVRTNFHGLKYTGGTKSYNTVHHSHSKSLLLSTTKPNSTRTTRTTNKAMELKGCEWWNDRLLGLWSNYDKKFSWLLRNSMHVRTTDGSVR